MGHDSGISNTEESSANPNHVRFFKYRVYSELNFSVPTAFYSNFLYHTVEKFVAVILGTLDVMICKRRPEILK